MSADRDPLPDWLSPAAIDRLKAIASGIPENMALAYLRHGRGRKTMRLMRRLFPSLSSERLHELFEIYWSKR